MQIEDETGYALDRRDDDYRVARRGGDSLADVLERVLDKGIVIAGDITVNLLEIELLTIKVRLLIASVDKAREIGIDWWESDPALSAQTRHLAGQNRELRQRLDRVEALLDRAGAGRGLGEGAGDQESTARSRAERDE
jgi:hypothetical protein